ncbi:hypothetical protein K435DRAFT_838921 [Dendrothele bispora CBS 962.96]|uniref:Extracellular membrane protein CFEM domain-containing protein n=1 Tax=Dendrothele bispora (strain CBS 962.96) TaxID=1314807 RepID=A0A4S8M4W1_DENBC|nr:hypothetical protein K435DRAFT_838921 [Dendrothele bispora CBS 962.96]
MYRVTSTSLLTLALASLSVSGTAVDFAHPFRQLLVARQSGELIDPSIIPTQCQGQCNDIVTTINACDASDLDCGCTTQDYSDFTNCLNCFASLEPSLTSVLQDNLDEVRDACGSLGIDLPSTTISGGGAVSASASGAGSVTVSRSSGGGIGFTEFSSGTARATPTSTRSIPTTTSVSPSDDSDSDSSNDDGLSSGDNGSAIALRGCTTLLVVAGVVFGGAFMISDMFSESGFMISLFVRRLNPANPLPRTLNRINHLRYMNWYTSHLKVDGAYIVHKD